MQRRRAHARALRERTGVSVSNWQAPFSAVEAVAEACAAVPPEHRAPGTFLVRFPEAEGFEPD